MCSDRFVISGVALSSYVSANLVQLSLGVESACWKLSIWMMAGVEWESAKELYLNSTIC